MALLTYLDASGDEHHPVMSVAGFVSRREQWSEFEREWADVLAGEGVRELHMTDFAQFQGEFQGWESEGDLKRIAFINELWAVIDRHTIKNGGVSLILEDYERFNKALRLSETLGNPYAFTGIAAISSIVTWRDLKRPSEPIDFVVEAGDYGQGELIDILQHFGYFDQGISVTPKAKRWTDPQTKETRYCYPFQACDYAAYEHRKATLKSYQEDVDEITPRKTLSLIAPRERDVTWRFIDVGGLREWCRGFRIPPRGRGLHGPYERPGQR